MTTQQGDSLCNQLFTEQVIAFFQNNLTTTGWITKLVDTPIIFITLVIINGILTLFGSVDFFNPISVSLTVMLIIKCAYYQINPLVDQFARGVRGVLSPTLSEAVTELNTHVTSTVNAAITPVTEAVQHTLDSIPVTIQAATTAVRQGIDGLKVNADELSLKGTFQKALDHKAGLIACGHTLYAAQDRNVIASEFIKIASILGFEKRFMNTVLNAVLNAGEAALNAQTRPVVSQQALEDIATIFKENTWTAKRTMGLAGLAASLAGVEISGAPILSGITGATAKAKALEDIWEKIEEYLNTLGLLSTGKWAYLKELGERIQALETEAVEIGKNIAVRPGLYVRPVQYKKFQDFRKRLMTLSAALNRNQCPDVRSSKALIATQALQARVEVWATNIEQIRSTTGIRPKPVGVCVFAQEPQIGKSTLSATIIRRCNQKLQQLYDLDPDHNATFEGASSWTTWNMSVRDEYDQNYAGNENVYADDAFSDIKNQDHAMWLTFISNEAIGTKQAELHNKGLGFVARCCVVSSNSLPMTSVAINNVKALQQRWPFTVHCKKVGTIPEQHDDDFNHLRLHVGPMHEHCWNNAEGCTDELTVPGCKCKDMTVSELVDAIVEWQLKEQSYYLSRLENSTCNDTATVRLQMYEYPSEDDDMTEEELNALLEDADEDPSSSHIQQIPPFKPKGAMDTIVESDDEYESDEIIVEVEEEEQVEVIDVKGGIVYPTPAPIYTPGTFVDFIQEGVDETTHANVFDVDEAPDPTRINLSTVQPPTTFADQAEAYDPQGFKPGLCSTGNVNALRNLIFKAYSEDRLVDPGDPRIMAFAKHLIHRNGVTLLRNEINSGVFQDAYELFQVLSVYKPIVGQEDEFAKALANFSRMPWRIVDTRLETDYLWSFQLNGGNQLIAIPFIENGGDPTTCTELLDFLALLKDHEVSAQTLKNGFVRWRFETRNLRRLYTEMSFMRIFINMLKRNPFSRFFWVNAAYRPVYRFRMSHIAREVGFCRTRWQSVNMCTNFAIDTIFTVPVAVYDFLQWFRSYVRICADAIHYLSLRILNIFGFEVGQFVYDLTEFVSNYSAYTLATILLGIVGGIVYSLYKFLTGKPKSVKDEGYNGQPKIKAPRRMLIKKVCAQMDTGKRFVEVETPKIDYYLERDRPCPFCESEWGQGGAVFKDDNIEVRHNLHTPEGVDEAFVCVKRGDHEELFKQKEDLHANLTSTLAAFGELGCAPAQIHIEQGYYSDGSVPHIHSKLYNMDSVDGFMCEAEVECGFRSYEAHGEKCARIVFKGQLANLADDVSRICWPMIEISRSFSLRIETLDEINYTAFVFFTGTNIDGEDMVLCKRNIKALRVVFEKQSGVKAGISFKNVVQKQEVGGAKPKTSKKIVKEQSYDDVAIETLGRLTSTNQVMVIRPWKESESAEQRYQTFGQIKQGQVRSAGIGYNDGIFAPAHIACELHGFLYMLPLGKRATRSYTFVPGEQYTIIQVVTIDFDSDIAFCRLVTPDYMANFCYKKFGVVSEISNAIKNPVHFGKTLYRHLATDADVSRWSTRKFDMVQWHPATAMASSSIADVVGTIPMSFVKDGHNVVVERTNHVEGRRANSSTNLSMSGDCGGLYAIMDPKEPQKIFGFHVAGSDSHTYATLLTQERVDHLVIHQSPMPVYEQAYIEECPASTLHNIDATIPQISWDMEDPWHQLIGNGKGIHQPIGPDVKHFGNVSEPCLPNNCRSGNFLGAWHKSPFSEEFEEVYAPGIQHVKDPRLQAELPLDGNGKPSLVMKQNEPFAFDLPKPNMEVLDEVREAITSHLTSLLIDKQVGNHLGIIESQEMGLNGSYHNRFITGIDVTKASGYPWSTAPGFKKKGDLIEVDERTGKRSYTDRGARTLQTRVIYSLERAMENERVIEICADKLKDTCVKLKHVRNGKTRTFNNTPIERLIISNIINGNMREAYTQLFLKGDHFIGGDPLSNDWEALVDHLNQHPNWIFIDYENYDRRQCKEFGIAAERIWNDTIMLVDPDGYNNARWVESANAIESLMIDETTVWQTGHGNKSGDPRTTPRNNIINLCNMFYVWKIKTKSNWFKFRSNVQMVFFGDDAVLTVSDEFKDLFNFNTIAEVLATIGHVVTPGNKVEGDVQPDFADPCDVTFLKRYFRLKDGLYIAPLEKSSIESPFVWTQNSILDYRIWAQLITNNLVEASLWGKEYFDEFHSKLLNALRKNTFPSELRTVLAPTLATSYKEVWAEYKDKRMK